MPFTITMPKLSPTMETGAIAKWHKKEGDQVEPGDLLLEIATDKATVEHNALDGGWLRKILVHDGDEAEVNQPIAIFTEKQNESIEGYEPVSLVEKKLIEEVVQEEKAVPKKAVKPSAASGLSQPTFVPEEPLENYAFEVPVGHEHLKVTPLARKLAKEQGLELSTVKGSGPGGRIVKQDLEKAQKGGLVVFGRREAPTIKPGTYEEEKLSPMRQVIAQRLQEAKSFIPHFYVNQTVNVESLSALREQLSATGIKVSLNDFIIRACALALREHPNVNSGYHSVHQTLIRFKTIDIAVAVSVEGGLITPIIRHADYKNLGELSVESRYLAGKAREGKLAPEEYKGGSFTISNMGMFGISDFQAIINPPQAAILAVGGIQSVPVIKNGEIVQGKTMNLCLSCDHRVIDGVAGAQFIKTLQKYLENPAILII